VTRKVTANTQCSGQTTRDGPPIWWVGEGVHSIAERTIRYGMRMLIKILYSH
jgi:hypothetical protein